jgi:hypothetical protein
VDRHYRDYKDLLGFVEQESSRLLSTRSSRDHSFKNWLGKVNREYFRTLLPLVDFEEAMYRLL